MRDKEKIKAAKKRHYKKYKEKYKLKSRLWVEKNRERSRAIKAKWRKENHAKAREIETLSAIKNRPVKTAYQRRYRKENPGFSAAYCAKRRTMQLQRTPNWLTKEQLKEINSFYEAAAECQWLSEEPLHVDHIVPLQGKNVSGLHVPWNLRVVPRSINCRKSNKWA